MIINWACTKIQDWFKIKFNLNFSIININFKSCNKYQNTLGSNIDLNALHELSCLNKWSERGASVMCQMVTFPSNYAFQYVVLENLSIGAIVLLIKHLLQHSLWKWYAKSSAQMIMSHWVSEEVPLKEIRRLKLSTCYKVRLVTISDRGINEAASCCCWIL